mmetsp:Transcript_84160/g.243286  ORF Transcript_84160/g.243286 Transcript_84160/m.243286 type:complete len:113 (+) Transcript_84160:258-596(+)
MHYRTMTESAEASQEENETDLNQATNNREERFDTTTAKEEDEEYPTDRKATCDQKPIESVAKQQRTGEPDASMKLIMQVADLRAQPVDGARPPRERSGCRAGHGGAGGAHHE